MYALIAAREYGGEAELLATARTLLAMQRKWRKMLDDAQYPHPYACIGILTPTGLVNYFGDKLSDSQFIRRVYVKMGAEYA